jgi:hypothetical protein
VKLDAELEALAEGQHGLVTREQARGAGATDEMVNWRLRTGRWERMGRGVYRVRGSVPTWRQSLLAAILVAGPGTVASHRAAAALWRIPGFGDGPVEVSRLRGRSRGGVAGVLRETGVLSPSHVSALDRIPVTRPARTVLDICGVVHPMRAERALDNVLAIGLTGLAGLRVVLAEAGAHGRAGTAVLRRLVEARDDGHVPPESELEALFLAVVAAAGLPSPARQLQLGGTEAPVGRVDFAYRHARLVIEADSRRHHSSWLDTEADRRRDARLLAAGWHVLRVTWDQLARRPDEVVAALGGALARAS